MTGRIVLLIAAVLLFLAALLPSTYLIGPIVEARLFPVIAIKATDVRTQLVIVDGEPRARLYFRTESDKSAYRPCKLDSFGWHWAFNHSSEPAEIRVTETGEVFRPSSRPPGHSVSRELYTDIPEVAFSFASVQLTGTAFFECHSRWLLAYSLAIDVEIPSAEPLPLPVAEPEAE